LARFKELDDEVDEQDRAVRTKEAAAGTSRSFGPLSILMVCFAAI
jgi:hypothetical protein